MNPANAGKQARWIILGLTLLGLALRLAFLGTKCFWQDEGITVYFTQGPLYEDGSPALYFLLLRLFQILFGYGEVAGRLLSVITGTLSIPLFYLLARRLFGSPTALLSTLLLTISPYAIAVSQEMRMYSLLGLELIALLYCTWRILENTWGSVGVEDDPDYGITGNSSNSGKKSDWKWFLGVFLAGLAGIYTHVIFVFIMAFLTLMFIYYNWKTSRRKIFYWIITMATVVLAFVPEVIRWGQRVGTRNHMLVEPNLRAAEASLLVMLRAQMTFIIGFYYKIFKGELWHFPRVVLVILLAALLAGLVFAFWKTLRAKGSLPPDRRRAVRFIIVFFLLNFHLFLVLEVSSSRHMISLYIPFLLFLSWALGQLRATWRNLLLGLLGLFTLLSLVYYYRAPYFPYEETDWRGLGRYLETHAGPDDLVFFEGGRNPFYTILYYTPGFHGPKKYLNTKNWPADPYQLEFRREYATQPAILYQELLSQYKRVWLVSLTGYSNMFPTQEIVRPRSKQTFGPKLELYELE